VLERAGAVMTDAMSTAVDDSKPRATKPWDKLRRVRSGSQGAVSQPSSPGSPDVDSAHFHFLRDGRSNELNIANAAGGAVPSARRSEPTRGASVPARLSVHVGPTSSPAASNAPSRIYARAKSVSQADASPVGPSRSSSSLRFSESPTHSAVTRRNLPVSRSRSEKLGADRAFRVAGEASEPPANVSSGEGKEGKEGKDFDWLLRRQLEVEMSLRGSPLSSQDDVESLRETVAEFSLFFQRLKVSASRVSDAVQGRRPTKTANGSPRGVPMKDGKKGFLVPPEDLDAEPLCEPATLFQELLHRVAGFKSEGDAASMDEQKKIGDVPMHQAKVLYRANVARDAVLREVDAILGEEIVSELTSSVKKMRRMLRIKMEDANDVRMAEGAVRGARLFFDTLSKHAAENGKEEFEILQTLRAK